MESQELYAIKHKGASPVHVYKSSMNYDLLNTFPAQPKISWAENVTSHTAQTKISQVNSHDHQILSAILVAVATSLTIVTGN